MANQFLTISMITLEALRVLKNNLAFTMRVDRQYDGSFGVAGAKIGTVLNVRKPPRYLGGEGPNLTIEDAVETSVPLALNRQSHVGLRYTSQDLLLNIEDFSRRFVSPAIANLANKVDNAGLAQYVNVANYVGTPGVTPADLDIYLNAGATLDNNAAPDDGERYMIISPNMNAKIIFALKGLFNPQGTISKQYVKGEMGEAINFTWGKDQNVWTHKIGPLGGAPQVSGANQTGSQLLTKGWTNAVASRLVVGDIFTIDNVYQVNPQSRQSTGVLQPFVVTAPFSSAVDGTGTINIYPPITPAGAFQTVDSSPADSANITVFGNAATKTPQGMAFHRDSFTLACADLPLPEGVDKADRAADPEVGVSVRLVRQYDIMTDSWPTRVDILYGWATLRPETACRVVA